MTEQLRDFFSDPDVIACPHAYVTATRHLGPAFFEPHHGSLMVIGFGAAVDVLTRGDGAFSSAVSVIGPIPPLPFVPEGDDIAAQLDAARDALPWSAHLVCFDGRQHAEHRAFLTRLLTYKRLKGNEFYLTALADGLIDGFVADGGCEIVGDYAHAMSTYAISDMLGIPKADRARLLALIGAPPSQIAGDGAKVGADPLVFLKDMFDDYLRERIDRPRDDLLSELAHARLSDGSALGLERLSLLARFLFGAGQDTTSRLITTAVKMLAEDAALQAALRADPTQLASFIEEVLRSDPPVKAIYRIARRRTTVADVLVPAGTIVTVLLTGANADPAHFSDPERFEVDRPRVRDHLAFSRGAHGCPGAPLARIEAVVALSRLLARTDAIRLSEAHHGPPGHRRFDYEPTYSFRNLARLDARFTVADSGTNA